MSDPTTSLAGLGPGQFRARLTRLAVPNMFSSLVGMLAQFAVVAMLGQMNEAALYIRSLYLPVLVLFVALQLAVEVSNQVAVSIAYGKSDLGGIGAISGSFLRVGLLVLGSAAALIALAAPLVASLLGASTEHRDVFVSFLRWMALATACNVGSIVAASALRGCRRTGAAALNSMVVAAAQILGVLVLGWGLGWGVFSVPVATGGAGIVGLLLGLWRWRREGLGRIRPLAWRGDALSLLLGIGLPVAGGLLLISVANTAALWVLSPFGPDVVSGFAAAHSVQNVIIVPAVALGSAISITMNNFRGERRPDRLPCVWKSGLQVAVMIYVTVTLLAWWNRGFIARLISESPEVTAEVRQYLTIVGLTYAAVGLQLVLQTVVEQLKFGMYSLVVQAAYLGSTVVIGGLIARQTGDVYDFYRVSAVSNLVWLVPVIVLSWFVVRRVVRRE